MSTLPTPVRTAVDAAVRANAWSKIPRRNAVAWFCAFAFCLTVACREGWLHADAGAALLVILAVVCLGVSLGYARKADNAAARHRADTVSAGQEMS